MSATPRSLNLALFSATCLLTLSSGAAFASGKAQKPGAATKVAPAPTDYQAPHALPPVNKRPAKKDPLVAEEEPSPVPASGALSLAQLIDLALHNNMKILEARGKLEVARAERKAATDWKDPEIRLSYSTQTDVEVGDPYTESSTMMGTYRGTEFDRQNQFGVERVYGGPKADNIYIPSFRMETEHSRYNESRFQRIERRIIPGATSDKEITEIYERRRTNSRSNSVRYSNDKDGTKEERLSGSRQNSEKMIGREVKSIRHRDVTSPEEQLGILLRFPFPNPFEMRARVGEAEAEIAAADYETKAIENEIILEVRSLYEELSYAEALNHSYTALAAHQQKWTELSRIGALDKLAGAAGKTSSSRLSAMETRLKASELRLRLAKLVGLQDVRRISIPENFRHRIIDLSKVNADYLVQMASVYRSDLGLLHAKNDSARAAYRAERSAKIPVATFLDFGYAHQSDYQGRDANEFTVRLGVSLPLWSWLMNDRDKVPQAEARAYSRQIGRLQTNIETEVRSALQTLKMFDSELANSEKEQAALKVLMKNEGIGGAGLAKYPQEVQSETEEVLLQLSTDRLQLLRMYNQAVLELEAALGTRLEKVLPLKN